MACLERPALINEVVSMRLTKALAACAILIMTGLGSLAQAADAGAMLRQIHDARLGLMQTVAAFQSFQGAEGDPKKGKELDAQLADTRAKVAALQGGMQGAGVDEELAAMARSWDNTQITLSTAVEAISKEGFAEFAVMDAYMQSSAECEKALGAMQSRIVDSSGYKVNPTVQILRDQALLLQGMTTAYVERSNSQFGASYRADQEEEETIDAKAVRFSHSLDKLLAAIPPTSPHRSKIELVRTNWGFMEKSFMNYSEKTVPFLISKFSRETIQALGELATSMEGG